MLYTKQYKYIRYENFTSKNQNRGSERNRTNKNQNCNRQHDIRTSENFHITGLYHFMSRTEKHTFQNHNFFYKF
jgi:hypothetical protein